MSGVDGSAQRQFGELCPCLALWQDTSAVRKRLKGLGGAGPNAVPHTREGRGPVVVGFRVARPLPGQKANGALVLPSSELRWAFGLGPVAPVAFTRMALLGAGRAGPTRLRYTGTRSPGAALKEEPEGPATLVPQTGACHATLPKSSVSPNGAQTCMQRPQRHSSACS